MNAAITDRVVSYYSDTVTILYIKQLTDRDSLSQNVIKSIMEYCFGRKEPPKARETLESIIYADDCLIEQDENNVEGNIYVGMTILLFPMTRIISSST